MSMKPTMQDETAVRQIIRDLEAAWNNRDGHAYARSFAEDAHYRVIWGFAVEGREAIAQGHQEIFDGRYRNSRLEMQIENVRFLRPDVAYVEASSHLHNVDMPFEKAIATLVAVKENDQWHAMTFNNAGILPSSEG